MDGFKAMNSHLSPKDLALAIGVSESSLKRWVDEGRLAATRTVGGHRRIAFSEALRFIRVLGSPIVRPDLLGVPELTEPVVKLVASGGSEAALLASLQAGDSHQASGIIVAQYLSFRSIAAVCDGPLAFALHRLAEGQALANRGGASGGGAGGDHRAAAICAAAVQRLSTLLPPAADDSPIAVLVARDSDHGKLSATMAAACFVEAGVRTVLVGEQAPVDAIVEEARSPRVRFLWIGVTTPADRPPAELSDRLRALAAGVSGSSGVRVLVSAREFPGFGPAPLPNVHQILSMSELSASMRAALSSPITSPATPAARAAGNGHMRRAGASDSHRIEHAARATR